MFVTTVLVAIGRPVASRTWRSPFMPHVGSS